MLSGEDVCVCAKASADEKITLRRKHSGSTLHHAPLAPKEKTEPNALSKREPTSNEKLP